MQSNVGTETNPSIKSPFQFQIIFAGGLDAGVDDGDESGLFFF
jgi:hypothetical protein